MTSRGYGVGGAGTQPADEFAPALVNEKVALLLDVFEPWESAELGPSTDPVVIRRGQIGDGENTFYNRPFNVSQPNAGMKTNRTFSAPEVM